ncbi:uncharacterized protein LOC116258864 [Nymphaea colorata]|nr:uncharacterized protein LOC116258864 [Nymphaea colorata]XP_031492154.1 uncharacterized protein LOC116258864 [Nymphaea colorata]
MSRGQLTRRTKLLKHPLEKCKSKGACSNVVIIDVPETADQKEKGYAVPVMDKGLPSSDTIIIDDEDSVDVLSTSDVEELDDVNSNASSTKTCESSSCQEYIVEDSDDDECQACEHGRPSFRRSNCKERYVKGRSSKYGPSCSYFSHISSSSEDDDSDCELLEPSVEIRAEWEKAALRKQKGKGHRNDHFEVEDQTSVSGFSTNPKTFSCHTQTKVDVGNEIHIDHNFENEQSTEAPTSSNSDNGVHGGEGENTSRCAGTANGSIEDMFSRPAESEDIASSVCHLSKSSVQNPDFEQVDSSNINLGLGKESIFGEQNLSERKLQNDSSKSVSSCKEEVGLLEFQNDLIGDREKLKATDAYRLADQEEWESRHRELRMQAEEAQRLRKRKKAETLRLLDMERRQKQRLEEVRQTQKKDEETMNLKEQLRTEIRRKFDQFEFIYRDMASLLRGLGIQVGGTHYPTEHEVNAAYKKALVRFHPDRASRGDIRQQIEAEETFKMISRLKDKLPLTLNYLFPVPKPPW